MRHYLQLFSVLILFFLLVNPSNGQGIKSFSADPVEFIKEVASVYDGATNTKVKTEIAQVLGEFFVAWDSTYFSDDEKTLVIDNANMLLKRRLSTYPYLLRYFYIIGKLKNGPDQLANLSWLISLRDQDPKSSLKLMQNYIDLFYDFLSEKTLNKSSTFTWQVNDSSYLLVYDTVARFVFRETDLMCYTANDTSLIKSTSGVYFPTTSKWEGFGGKVSWRRNLLDPDSVYATLLDYKINLKFSNYSVDSVVFYNKHYFQEPLYGSFEDKVLSSPPGPLSSYPRFSSFLKNYEITSLFEDIDYFGGFSMEGARLIGSGERFENASILVLREGKPLMTVNSNSFYIEGDELSCNPASLVLFVDNDSIYHPGLQMKYRDSERAFRFIRPEEGLAQSPFFNTYHDLNMNCNAMFWSMDMDSINFETMMGVNRNSVVLFTSDNFFQKFDFYRLQGIDEKNPLYVIRSFASQYSTDEITPEMLSSFMNKPLEQAKSLLLRLSIQGFLFYDQVNDRAIIQDKLYHFIEASAGVKDYDVIKILSETFNEPNATLNLSTYDLLIRGVSEVLVSDSQQVYIYPDKKEILMKENRDFVFTGRVKAGLFEFFANECSFEYDSFRLNLPTVDSLTFSVKSFNKDQSGQFPLRKVGSVIEDVGGRILIDHPGNKSGLQPFPEFPVFISEKDSYVYYDHDTAYSRDRFKYTIFPYTIDSLDNFLTDNLQFEGYLESAGIFPEIRQPLKVQPDYSLGFITGTTADGYPVYEGKGRFTHEISLNNSGLWGNGELRYMTSVTLSDSLKFYPDSLMARVADTLKIGPRTGEVEYPDVLVDSIQLAWYPYQDTLLAVQLDGPFKLYRDQVSLAGGITYTPGALTGQGVVRFENAGMVSNRFYFDNQTFQSDTVDFAMYEKGSGDVAVTAGNYRSLVDLEQRKVQFQANQEGSAVAFPYNQFICYMDNIDWYMDKNEMLLTNNIDNTYPELKSKSREELIDLKMGGSEFVSTNPEMDSLKFFAAEAKYDLSKYFIFAEDVMLVRVADAVIFPDSGYVRIFEGGELDELRNCEIIADTLTKRHHIVQADIRILSRNRYEGSGTYLYQSPGQPVQNILMNEIVVDTNGVTNSHGRILEKDNFLLSPYFAFSGNVNLSAVEPYLDFEGGFRIFQDCYRTRRDDWVYFHDRINPENVVIPLGSPTRTVGGDAIETSLFISDYEDEIYPVVFENRKLADDIIMFKAFGNISYDTLSNSYRIFEQTADAPGEGDRYFYFGQKTCSVETYGQIDLGLDLGYVDVLSFGEIEYLIVPDSALFKMAITLDFFFEDNILNMMSDSITVADLKGIDIAGPDYYSTLQQLLGKEKADELRQDISVYGTMRRLPDELVHTIVLADVEMYWNPSTKSYRSRGPIGILSIGRNVINRYVDGYLELIKRRSADVMTLYLEISPSQYYYFDYRAEIMQAISSDFRFNDRIESIKTEKRTISKPDMEFPYEYTVSTRRKVLEFLRRMGD
jgi:hypothetical protein